MLEKMYLIPKPSTFQKHDRMEFKMNKIGGAPTESGVVCTQLSCQDPQVELLKIYIYVSRVCFSFSC